MKLRQKWNVWIWNFPMTYFENKSIKNYRNEEFNKSDKILG